MARQHPSEFFGIAGLMDDDVAHRPGLTPGARFGASPLHGLGERRELGEALGVDGVHTFIGTPQVVR
jgi:hypothetical protein